MKRSQILLQFLILCGITLYSCVSPLDTDTPRNRYADAGGSKPNGRLPAKSVTITVRSNSGDTLIWHTSITDTLIQIDTTKSALALWFSARVSLSNDIPKTPFISEFLFTADSIICDSRSIELVRDSNVTAAASFVVATETGPNGLRYTTYPAYPRIAYAYCSFRHYPGTREINGTFHGSLIQSQLSVYAEIAIVY
jgi:hypothetical protein